MSNFKSQINIFGIKSCDKVRSALKWLNQNMIEYNFIDLKSSKIKSSTLNFWLKNMGWVQLINKSSKTWRSLDDKTRENVINNETAKQIIINNPLILNRPIIEIEEKIIIGFSEKNCATWFK